MGKCSGRSQPPEVTRVRWDNGEWKWKVSSFISFATTKMDKRTSKRQNAKPQIKQQNIC